MRRILRKVPIETVLPRIDRAGFLGGEEGVCAVLPAGRFPMPEIISPGHERHTLPVQRPVGMPAQPESGLPTSIAWPELSIARLRDVLCLPGGLILKGDHVLLESFSAPWESGYHRHLAAEDDRGDLWSVASASLAEPLPVAAPMLHLDYQHNGFIGHFYMDALSRGWGAIYGRAWLGLDALQTPLSIVRPFMHTPLAALDLPVLGGHAFDRPLLLRELIVASKSMQIQHYTSPAADMLWDALRSRIVPDATGTGPDPALRLYVSRLRMPNRKLLNEAAVEAIFRDRGYQVIYPETLPLAQQIALFARAGAIAGCSGSNMFNLAFCHAEAEITLLVSPRLLHFSEMFFCHRQRRPLRIVLGHEPVGHPGDVHAPWTVDPDRL